MGLPLFRASLVTLVFALAVLQTGCSLPRFDDLTHIYRIEPAPHVDGKVILYPEGRFIHQAAAQADISLPFEPANKDWYAVLLMLTMYPHSGQSDAAYVQVGIMRWQRDNFAPTAYIGIKKHHGRELFRYLRDVRLTADGGHATIRMTSERVIIEFNGQELLSTPRREVFPKGSVPYFQIAAQVDQPGDRVAGVVRNLVVQSDNAQTLEAVTTPCMYEDP